MAVIDSKIFGLRDGSRVIIRVGETQDAEAVLSNGLSFIEDGDGQVLTPGELILSVDDEIKWIESHSEKPTNLLLVAELNGNLVGHLDFYGGSRKRLRHTGHFGMGICSPHRGNGIGRALLTRLVEWAKTNSELEKINLNVLSSNTKAVTLYRSFGFKEVGRRSREVKMEDGSYIDDIAMELMLQ